MAGRLAAFVVTFRREGILPVSLERLLSQTRPPDHVLVVDNASSAAAEDAVHRLADPRVVYRAMPENLGPAGASAFALGHLRDAGFDWILWGDDDDPPKTEDTIERLCLLLETESTSDLAGVAAVGVRWSWRTGETLRPADRELAGPLEIDIAGGGQHLLVRSACLTEARMPDPRLFFGYEDFDFCLRLRRDGLRLLADGDLLGEYRRLAGRLGLGSRPRRLDAARRQAPWRRYYATRNYIHLMRRTFARPDLAAREAAKATLRSALAWRERPRVAWRFASYQLAGVRDGYLDRMGLTVVPDPSLRGKERAA